jgi:hypothetical protein
MIGSTAYEVFNGAGADICGNIEDSPNCIAFHTNKYKYNKM